MAYNKFILLLTILSSEVLSNDSTGETDPKYILHPYNDSSFYVQSLETKSEKNQDGSLKEWVFSPSTVNAILGNILKSNEGFTLKKREVGFRDDSSRRHTRKTKDAYFTLYNGTMNEDFNITNYFRHMRQAGSLSEADVEEADVEVSILSALLNNSVKAIKERENITVRPMPLFKNINSSTVQSQTELYVSNQDNITSLDKKENTTIPSKKFQNFNEILSTEIFENISGTSFSTTMTSSDVNIYTPHKITGSNINHLKLGTPSFTSEDSLTSVSVDSTHKQHSTQNFTSKSNTDTRFDDSNTTLDITKYTPLLKEYDYKTEPSSTSTFVADFMNDTSNNIVENTVSTVSPSVIRKHDEKETTSATDFLPTESSTTFLTDLTLYKHSQSIKDEHNITNNPTSSTVSSSTSVTDFPLYISSQSINKGENTVIENSTSTSVSNLFSYNISVSPQSFTEDKSLHYNSSSGSPSTTIPVTTRTRESTRRSNSSDLSLAEIKLLPNGEQANRVLVIGIILCCLTSLVLVSILIIFLYNRRKKSTCHQIEMTQMNFEEV